MRRSLLIAVLGAGLVVGGCGASRPAPRPASPVPAAPPSPYIEGVAAPAGAAAALRTPDPPVRLSIPAIGVSAPVERVGVLPGGALGVPDGWTEVGWFSGGPAPGQPGDAIIDGHLDSYTAPAVFWNLDRLRPGDAVVVTTAGGHILRFSVSARADEPADAPLGQLLSRTGAPRLALITCAGSWIQSEHMYSERLVVTAALENGPALPASGGEA
jgi:hypothetical protein